MNFISELVQISKNLSIDLDGLWIELKNWYFCLNKQEAYGRQLILFLLFVQLTASFESHLLVYRLGVKLNNLQISHPNLFNSWRQTG